MSEEYLARTHADVIWLVGVFVIMILIILAGFIYTRNMEPKERLHNRKKFSWAAVVVLVGYFFITVPYTGFFFRFGEDQDAPVKVDTVDAAERYVTNHERRISRLEMELEESREQLREVRDHYQRLLQFLMMGVFVFGFSQIFKKRDAEPDQRSTLKLND